MYFYQRSSNNSPSGKSQLVETCRRARLLLAAVLGIFILGLGLASAVSASSAPASSARVPSARLAAVTLIYFRGTGQDNAILLEWATGTEFNTAGFRLTRSDGQAGQFRALDQIGFVPAEGDGLIGAEYSAIDSDNIVNGEVYWYELIEIELDGTENVAGPISARAGLIPATATSTTEPTSTESAPGGGSPSTATPENAPGELTATPTPVSQGNIQNTATPTVRAAGTNPTTPVAGSPLPSIPSPISNQGNSNPSGTAPFATPAATLDLSSYPAPDVPETDEAPRDLRSVADNGYPSIEAANPTLASASYPSGSEGRLPNLTPPVDIVDTDESKVIGNQDVRPIGKGDSGEGSGNGASAVMLWIGFFAALLVFIAGVIGSIVYFSRQRMQGR